MIKVIIERQIAEGLTSNYTELAQQMLIATLKAPGYISGESWQDQDNINCRVIITNWRSRQAWEWWYASDARKQALDLLQPIIEGDEKIWVLG